MRKLLVFLVVVVVLALLVDRGTDYAAEQVAASKLQDDESLPGKPSVHIDGFPFLTQVAAGHYDHIQVTAKHVDLADKLTLGTLRVNLRDVRTDARFTTFTVAHATASATVTYAQLGALLGTTVTYACDGAIRATQDVTVLGHTISPGVTVKPELADGALAFGSGRIDGLSGLTKDVIAALPPDLSSELEGTFADPIPLDQLPFDITVTGLLADDGGLELTLSGTQLRYSRS